jgi:hypothetical protein
VGVDNYIYEIEDYLPCLRYGESDEVEYQEANMIVESLSNPQTWIHGGMLKYLNTFLFPIHHFTPGIFLL